MTAQEKIGEEYRTATDYQAIVERIFNERDIPDVLERVVKVMDSMAESFDHNRAFHEMLSSDFDSMLKYIEDASDKQLIADIKNVFGV